MNSTFSLAKSKKIFLGLLSFALLISCGSFQSASYFETDGIYVSKKSNSQVASQEVTQDTYYSQYFQDVADGYIPETTQETYFTDTDTYTSSGQNQSSDIDSASSQIPWGEQTAQTEIIVVNNSPNMFWGGLSGFAFRTSSFWNNYYGDSFRFGYGNFFNPFFNPYQSNFGFWGRGNQFFNPYMNPYSAYSNFYSPYGYANFWNFNQRWRGNRFMNGYNNQNLNDRDFASTVARVRSGRGEKNYGNSSDRNNRNDDSKESKSDARDVQRTINRINVGRGVSSIGRGVSIGSIGTNQLRENIASNSRSTIFRNTGSTSGITGFYRSNTNITKSLLGNSSGRVSLSRNSLGARNNNNNTSSPRTLRPVKTRRPVVVNNRQPAVRRAVQQPIKRANTSYNRPKKNNSSPARSYNSTPARSYNSTPARSYNSGSSSRGSSSGASGGGSGRSSSGGRRN